jgi:predicted DNA-binding transcriptional regulator YafY
MGVFEPDDEGVLLAAQADDLDWFARELSRLPFEFEIGGPAALRTALDCCAERLRRIAST